MKFTVALSSSFLSKIIVDVCGFPFAPSVSELSPVGSTLATIGLYLAVTDVPFLSTRLTVTSGASPTKSLSGVKVTVPSFATVYVPTLSTVLLFWPLSNVAGTSSSIGTSGFPGVNTGVPVCTFPWSPVDVVSFPVGVTFITVGLYFAATAVPFLSTRLTVTSGASPTKSLSGVNVTVPSFATVYVPTLSTVLVTFPSSNVAGTSSSIGTSGFPGVNSGVPVCTFPCRPVDVVSFPVGVTFSTVGLYFAVTAVPFLSTRLTVTSGASPLKALSGVNVTVPSFATVYVPTLSTVLLFWPLSNVAGTSSSIGTSGFPGVNTGVPVCTFPWSPVDVVSFPVGVTFITVGLYFAATAVPFLSTRLTVTSGASPTKSLSGVNVTVPSFATVYVPTLSTVLVTLPSSNVAGDSSFIGTSGEPGVNSGFPVCTFPCRPVDVVSFPVGRTSTTLGTYFCLTTLPLASSTCTVTPSGFPLNVFNGVNVITPSFNS